MTQTSEPIYRATSAPRHVERLDDETLVYDMTTDHVYRLAADASTVLDACVGGTTVSAISAATNLDSTRVEAALVELAGAELVERIGDDGFSRRAFNTRVVLGVVGVAGAALVTSIAAPTPAAAASGSPGGGGGSPGGGCDDPPGEGCNGG